MSAALNHVLESDYRSTAENKPIKNKSRKYRRILIVDDDMDTAQSIKYIAESYGENVFCEIVCDPYEALIALSDHEFDMLLIDQKIPGLEGTSILSKIDEFVDQDPLIIESGRYTDSIPTVIMSGSEVSLPVGFKLKNFKLERIINKNSLPKFLSESFAN
ncbi:MAG: response regulator [Bdellovibrionota bacterium]